MGKNGVQRDFPREMTYTAGCGLFFCRPQSAGVAFFSCLLYTSRAIRASASVLSLLRSYRSWQLQQRLKIGDKWQEYDRLFTTWSGKPIHPDTLSGWFHNFIKNNGFTPIHIHSLRHTNATLLIAAGTNIPTVSSRLGHANPSTTTKIYTHAIQSADAAAAETLDDLLHPIKKKA